MDSLWLWVILASFATFRCASIVTAEDGPFDIFFRLRYWSGKKFPALHKGLRCFACTSVWFGMFFSVLISTNLREWVILAFAISALALFIYMIDIKFFSS